MSADQALRDFEGMLRIRRFEEKVRELRLEGSIAGSVHLEIGQEAGPVGVASVLEPRDAMFATYRGHGWAIARGVPLVPLFAELMGRETGLNGGRGGSAYFTAPQYGFNGENSIVGAGAPIAVGAALAGRYDGSNRVAVTVFGDGAMNQGAVHEAMNLASAFKLPVVFVCENNGWSELTDIAEMVGDADLWRRAAGYGMHGERLDGRDPVIVRARAERAIATARAGDGPVLLELVTARLVGHYIGDAEQYRKPGELEEALAREPIARIRASLVELGVGEAALAHVDSRIAWEVDEATSAAKSAPVADPASAKDHIYA